MITVLVTANAAARNSKFLGQRYAFMTPGATFSRDGCRRRRGCLINGRFDVVYAVAVSASRSSRDPARHCLPMNTLNEFR